MKKLLLILTALLIVVTPTDAKDKNPFKFESKNVSLQFGGFVRSVMFADFNGSVPHEDFKVSLASSPDDWAKSGRFNLDASASRVFFRAIQKSKSLGDIEYYIESDFRGSNDLLRLRQAYISFKGIIFGQAWSFMVDMGSAAPTIDVQGVNSRTFYRTALFGYRKQLCSHISFGVSLEQTAAKIAETDIFKSTYQRLPDIPIYLKYEGKAGHIKVTGLNRFISFADHNSQNVVTNHAYGGQLSGSLKVTPAITLYSQAIAGKGVARYINDLLALSLDAYPTGDGTTMENLPVYSYSIGAQAKLSKRISLTASYSGAGVNDKNYSTVGSDYLNSHYTSTTLFWSLRSNFQVAFEFLSGKRFDIDGGVKGANRAQFMFQYKW